MRQRLDTLIEPLRQLHGGEVGDYVAWMTVGTAAFGILAITLLR